MPTDLFEGGGASAPVRALVVEDPASQGLLSRIAQIAPSDATVLITGETGTGKEVVARHIHAQSQRATEPFVAINCGALSPSLVESELFGHERGAFTGALASRAGWFETASGGTLFLDEVGDLPLAAQVTLLRVLQEREVVRVGARRSIPVDVRLIAATKVDLRRAVVGGRFREDLFYRLHVAPLAIAPLRDRPGDILPLAQHFLLVYARRLGQRKAELRPAAIARLREHDWPGNVRELENAVHHALLVCHEGTIDVADLPLPPLGAVSSLPPFSAAHAPPRLALAGADWARERLATAFEASLTALIDLQPSNLYDRVEEAVFRLAYEASEGNQARTARILGISRNVVRARLLQHGIAGRPGVSGPPPAPPSPLPAGRPGLRTVPLVGWETR